MIGFNLLFFWFANKNSKKNNIKLYLQYKIKFKE